MISGSGRPLGCIGVLAGDVSVCAMLFSLSVLFDITMNTLLILPWTACLIIQFAVGNVMVQRGSSVNVFLIFHIAFTAAEIVIIYLCASRLSQNPNLIEILALAVAATGIHAAVISWKSPSENIISCYSDILIVSLALYLLAFNMAGPKLSVGLILFSAAALAVNLVSAAILRTKQGGSSVSRGAGFGTAAVLVGIFLLCLLITGAVVGIASGTVHNFLDLLLTGGRFIWRILSVLFHALGTVLEIVVLFFIRLFSSSGTGSEESFSSASDSNTAADFAAEAGNLNIPSWFFSLIMIIAACVVLIVILRYLRRLRFAKREKTSKTLRVRRTSHLKEAIRAIFRKIKERIQFEWLYRKFRNTPQGIFLFLLRKCRRKKLRRRRDESPGGFVRRICGLDLCADGRDTLLALASLLDETYYAGKEHTFEKSEYQIYVQAVNAFLGAAGKNK